MGPVPDFPEALAWLVGSKPLLMHPRQKEPQDM
jgi:hypothetical protein